MDMISFSGRLVVLPFQLITRTFYLRGALFMGRNRANQAELNHQDTKEPLNIHLGVT